MAEQRMHVYTRTQIGGCNHAFRFAGGLAAAVYMEQRKGRED